MYAFPSASSVFTSKTTTECKIKHRALLHLHVAVKQTVLMNWKIQKNSYSVANWLEEYMDLVAIEEAAHILQLN